MIATLAMLLVNLFGLDFATAAKWVRRAVLAIALLFLLLVAIFIFRSCGRRETVTIDPVRQAEAERAIEQRNFDRLREVMANQSAADEQIDQKIGNAQTESMNRVANVRRELREMSDDEVLRRYQEVYGR